MLQHDAAVDEVEVARREEREIGLHVADEEAPAGGGVVPLGQVQHLLGDVHADRLIESRCQRPGQPAGAAAEVEHPPAAHRQAKLSGTGQRLLDLLGALGEERGRIPAAVPALRVDAYRPQRIGVGQPAPRTPVDRQLKL
jgi:hypothetical protein